MTREEIIDKFCSMGDWINCSLENGEFNAVLQTAFAKNPWFCPTFSRKALEGIALWLKKDSLEAFVKPYSFAAEAKKVAVIAAGNIPAVAFHDIMCVLLSGNEVVCKLSHKDEVLLPFLFGKYFPQEVVFESEKLKSFQAVIATGSDNTALLFENYFAKYPHIIRHSRSSVAILSGKETALQLQGLAEDMLLYAGLGCRNTSLLFVPKGYDFTLLAQACQNFLWLMDLNKYRNNLDYHRAIFTMNNVHFEDLESVLLTENTELNSAVSVVNYSFYTSEAEIEDFLSENREKIQIVSGNCSSIACESFGKAQEPQIDDFADGLDTMKWLDGLR